VAALSRALGGYHIPVDKDVGLNMGRAGRLVVAAASGLL